MINQEVKGTLAKLLATENLTVEHRKVSTACFDVEKRLLILPIWKTATETVYDLLVGHEVGHALYTPQGNWGTAPKAFVNVIEDARIERMMKVTYPGLRKSFFEGYKQLWNDDFFGVKHDDPETLSLIDRINLYFKGNPSMPFTADEEVWVKRTAETKTFEDVIKLAEDLYEYACKKQEKIDEISAPESDDGELQADKQEEVTPTTSDGEKGDAEEDWFTDDNPTKRPQEREVDPDLETPSYTSDAPKIGGTTGGEQFPMDETESVTDAALQESLETLIDDNAKEWIYLNLPKIDLKEIIQPHDQVQKDLQEWYYEREYPSEDHAEYIKNNLEYALGKYKEFKKNAQKSVNYLVKQFEMKKSAAEYRRSATSKTGVIDTNKLFKYKLTEDIFKKVTIVPEGKNHGLVMYLDWSGSMQYQMLDTLKQLYNLMWFCKKAGIPFRVYAFQNGLSYDFEHDQEGHPGFEREKNLLAPTRDFRLVEFFSSRQNSKSLEKSMELTFLQVFAMGGHRISADPKYNLGGTPLAEAIMCSREIVDLLRKVENITKVTMICLTDGESNPISFLTPTPEEVTWTTDKFKSQYLCHHRNCVFFLRDPKTGYSRKINSDPYNTTKEIVSYFKEITDFNWVGIRICSKAELSRLVRFTAPEIFGRVEEQWRKHRFASIKTEMGYHESFYMPDKNNGEGTMELEVKQKGEVATRAELGRAFKKHMGSKMTNKTVLNAFIEQIA